VLEDIVTYSPQLCIATFCTFFYEPIVSIELDKAASILQLRLFQLCKPTPHTCLTELDKS